MDDLKRFKDDELMALIDKLNDRLQIIESESIKIRQELVTYVNEATRRNINRASA